MKGAKQPVRPAVGSWCGRCHRPLTGPSAKRCQWCGESQPACEESDQDRADAAAEQTH